MKKKLNLLYNVTKSNNKKVSKELLHYILYRIVSIMFVEKI